MSTSFENAEKILEAALFSSAEPLPVDKLAQLFPAEHRPSLGDIRTWLLNLKTSYEARGVELVEVASGYRFQIKTEFALRYYIKSKYKKQKQIKFIYFLTNYTLNLKCITSPSFTTYSLPSTRIFPASFTLDSLPYFTKSS